MFRSCYIIWFCHERHINIFIINDLFHEALYSVCCLILTGHFFVNLMKALICETYFHISANRTLSLFSHENTKTKIPTIPVPIKKGNSLSVINGNRSEPCMYYAQ
jgi:hypothetical protein